MSGYAERGDQPERTHQVKENEQREAGKPGNPLVSEKYGEKKQVSEKPGGPDEMVGHAIGRALRQRMKPRLRRDKTIRKV